MIQAIYSGQAAPQPVSEQVIAAVVAKTDHAERHQVAAKLLPSLAGMYDKVFDMTSPFALRPTVAYTGKPEFCVIATQTILAGTVIPGLEAVLVPFVGELTPRTKRSVVRVQKSQADVGLMGPLSRVNHECKAWTVKFVKRNGKMSGFQVVQAQAVRDMHHGDEITVNYGPDYFGDDNEDCLCRSDELDRSNGWSDGPQPDHMVDLVVHREKSRRATADARKSALETRVYSYRPWALPDGPRRPGDHVRALSGLPTSRCVTLHCRMRFVDLPFGSMCAGCEQQALAHAQSTASTLQRYYRALARSEKPLGLYHTQTPLASIAEYLKTLEIPGWRIYARPIRFNSGRHKTLDMRDAVPDSPEAIDLPVGASCDSAAADGGRQTGQIWLTVGDWRPDEANNLVEFREVTTTLYASVLLLRKRKVYPIPFTRHSVTQGLLTCTRCISSIHVFQVALTRGPARVRKARCQLV